MPSSLLLGKQSYIPEPYGRNLRASRQHDFVCVSKVIDSYLTPTSAIVIYHDHILVTRREGIHKRSSQEFSWF